MLMVGVLVSVPATFPRSRGVKKHPVRPRQRGRSSSRSMLRSSVGGSLLSSPLPFMSASSCCRSHFAGAHWKFFRRSLSLCIGQLWLLAGRWNGLNRRRRSLVEICYSSMVQRGVRLVVRVGRGGGRGVR